MCLYRPYQYTCGHGTVSNPAFHLLGPCPEYGRLLAGQLCRYAKHHDTLVDTQFACWDCHSVQFKSIGREPNLWIYNVIVNKLGSGECASLLRKDRIYYRALLCRVGPDGAPIPGVKVGRQTGVVLKVEGGGQDGGRVGLVRAGSDESEATIEADLVRVKRVGSVPSPDAYDGDDEDGMRKAKYPDGGSANPQGFSLECWESDGFMSEEQAATLREETPAYEHAASPERIATVFDTLCHLRNP